MSKIDRIKINKYLEGVKQVRPKFIWIDHQEWEDALDGYDESFSNAVEEETTTEQYWMLVYFSAVAFCKGLQYAKIKSGEKEQDFYPKH